MSPSYPIARFSPNEYMQRWSQMLERLDYRNQRRLLWRKIEPRLPRFLYKYRCMDQPHSREKLREILVDSVLQLRSPSGFNDPFDMSAHFVIEGSDYQRRTRFKELIRSQAPSMPWKQQQEAIRRLMYASEKELHEVCRQALSGIRATTGVYCFAGTAKSTLMWSHYAQDHTGVCIQFERVRDYRVLLHALPVVYDREFPQVNWIEGMQEAIGTMLFAKHPDWRYEQESRMILIGQADKYLMIAPAAVTGIILGCRCSPQVAARVAEILSERAARGHPPVRVYDAVKHASKYRLVVRQRRATNVQLPG